MLKRREDWPRRLHAFLRERRAQPYVYGSNDCFWFSHAAVMAMTDSDILPGVAPPMSRLAAARFLLARGYGDVEGLMTALVGPPRDSPKLMGRGDIVSFVNGESDQPHLAIVTGSSAATPGRDGILWVPRMMWRRGWRV